MLIFFVAVVSVIAGAVLLGLGVFFYVLLKSIRQMAASTESLIQMLRPVLSSGQLGDSLTAFGKLGGKLGALLAAVNAQTAVLNQFQKMWMTQEAAAGYQEAVDKETKVVSEGSAFYAPTEAKLAGEEILSQLREQGIEADEDRMENPPDISQMRGVNA